MRLTMALFAILTPYPGTRLYRRLLAEGRLTNERWWLGQGHDALSPYFVPARMSRERLYEGWMRAWQRFYTPGAMLSRWTVRRQSSWIQTLGYWPLNLMQNRLVRHKIMGKNARFLTQASAGTEDGELWFPAAETASGQGADGRDTGRQLPVLQG
jgi:hypothetical protein